MKIQSRIHMASDGRTAYIMSEMGRGGVDLIIYETRSSTGNIKCSVLGSAKKVLSDKDLAKLEAFCELQWYKFGFETRAWFFFNKLSRKHPELPLGEF